MARNPDLDTRAAVTRSLLGWGVVAGPFYVAFALILAFTRPGFDITRHSLSLLTLGDLGQLQSINLILTGVMAILAAVGVLRAIQNGRGLAVGSLAIVYGVGLILSAVFLPDPVLGFPPASTGGEFSIGGILHLLFGGLGFLAIAIAAFAHAAWSRRIGNSRRARLSAVLGVVIIIGFIGGAAFSQNSVGVALLWLAVLAQFTWLAAASSQIYSWTPSPLRPRSEQPA